MPKTFLGSTKPNGVFNCESTFLILHGHLNVLKDHLNNLWLNKQKANPVILCVTPRDGCVTCHTRHASVTDFRPIWGNTVEVAHMTSSVMYINSHAKGTSLPLARITTMIPPFEP